MASQVELVGPDGQRARVSAKVAGLLAGRGYRPADAPTASPPAPKPSPSEALPPGGSVADVLAWVGGDPARASTALQVEEGRDQPRKSLVAKLEALIPE